MAGSSPDARAAPLTASLPPGRLALLFAVMLVTAAGNTAMQSVMPSIGTSLGVADVWISLAYTWSALLWMLCAPFWARRSDQRGRKAMMALGLVGFAASFTLCGTALWLGLSGWMGGLATLLAFAAARSLYGGFGSAAPPAVQAYVASRTERAERTGKMALISSSFGLGTVVGPALAPLMIVPGLGLVGPFVAFALIGFAMLAALRLRLPDDTPAFPGHGDVTAAPFAGSLPAPPVEDDPATPHERLAWRDRRLRPWLVCGLLGGHAQAMVLGLVGFLVLDRLGLRHAPAGGAGPTGLVLMAGALATLLAQWGLIPMLGMGPRASCLWGAAAGAAGVAILALAGDLHAIALGLAVASLGFGLVRPGFTAGSSLAVGRAQQGEAAGIVASLNGAAYIVAPAIGVWIYGRDPWVVFALIAGLCVALVAYGWRHLPPDVAA